MELEAGPPRMFAISEAAILSCSRYREGAVEPNMQLA